MQGMSFKREADRRALTLRIRHEVPHPPHKSVIVRWRQASRLRIVPPAQLEAEYYEPLRPVVAA